MGQSARMSRLGIEEEDRGGSQSKIFIDKIGQQYAGEVIIGESQKMGFQPIKYQQNTDGSNTLVLERWNGSNLYL